MYIYIYIFVPLFDFYYLLLNYHIFHAFTSHCCPAYL